MGLLAHNAIQLQELVPQLLLHMQPGIFRVIESALDLQPAAGILRVMLWAMLQDK